MMHAEKLMNRILFLEGTPNMTDLGPIKVGTNCEGAAGQRPGAGIGRGEPSEHGAIKDARDAGDNASRALFEEILIDEEEHVDYLEGQLHAIGQMGIENYLAQQLHKGEEDEKD